MSANRLRARATCGADLIVATALLAAGLLPQSVAYAQAEPSRIAESLRNRIEAAGVPPKLTVGNELIHASRALPAFYERRGYEPAWSRDSGLSPYCDRLVNAIRDADREGLRAADYHLVRIESILERIREATRNGRQPAMGLLVDLDLLLTDTFVIYGSHLLVGRVNPETIDPEWVANRRDVDMALVLQTSLDSGGIEAELSKLLPPQPGYSRLKNALAKYRSIEERGGWPSIPEGDKLQAGDGGPRVQALRTRLSMTGDLDTRPDDGDTEFDEPLEQAVIKFQRRHGLDTDGVVGSATLAALNVRVVERVEQIKTNMERWRWLPQDLGRRYVLVNIANFELDVVEEGRIALSMRAIVGRDHRRTPVFSDKMTYIVFSPYWNVPPGIAANDIIPAVRKDPGYLASKNIKVFQGWGADAKAVTPEAVDWSRVNAGSSGYRFRQDPGPNNALGRIKFMFPNKFNVYLHDTPSTELFQKTQRAFSSGCIRIQKPIELAEYVLRGDFKWTRDAILEQIQKWTEHTVPLAEPIPVHLLYWTAWADEDGTVHFRRDIYKRDTKLENALDKSAPRS